MRKIKKLFGVDKIYDRKYGFAFVADAGIGFVAVYVSSIFSKVAQNGFSVFIPNFIKLLVLLYFAIELYQALYVRLVIKRRNYIVLPQHANRTKLSESAMNEELNKIDDQKLIAESEDWNLFDVRFDFHRKSKRGKYKSKEAFYTVFEAKLARSVPHLVFDSKIGKKRQFKSIFLQSQRLSLEGDFDTYFDTYAPQWYHIDTLSFITPEVMQNMINLKEYDVEFVGDSMLCFAPLLTKKEIDDFKKRCLALYESVNDNISTYSDSRLDEQSKDVGVTNFGKRLLTSAQRYFPLLVLSGLATVAVIGYAFWAGSITVVANDFSIVAIALFISSSIKTFKVLRENKQREAEFLRLYKSQHKAGAQKT